MAWYKSGPAGQMQIGNDIVDLRDPEALRVHPRFDARVFTPAEREWIARGAATRRRWLLWAAKEAAFKCWRQRDRSLAFVPCRISVAPGPGGNGRVEGEPGPLHLRWLVGEDWVHAVAAADRPSLRSAGVVGLRASRPLRRPQASALARLLLRHRLGRLLRMPAGRLRVTAAEGGPRLVAAGQPLRAAASISHHGRFVAVALLVSPDLAGAVRGPQRRGAA